MKAQLRLEFEYVFPDEEPKSVIEYLQKVSSYTLLHSIGFSTGRDLPNYNTFFSNPLTQVDVIRRVQAYQRRFQMSGELGVISREGSLRIAEIILGNRDTLINSNTNDDRDSDELNLFKAYLVANKEANAKEKMFDTGDNIEKMVDMSITMMFPISDTGVFENSDLEFLKVLYATSVRFDMLLEFFKSDPEYAYLEKDLYTYFGQKDIDSLNEQVKYLFGTLLSLKAKNNYKLKIEDEDALCFLNTLVADSIVESPDFTGLKNHPLYKIEENIFSIIDFFFVVDKFFKSVKFILKKSYNDHHNLNPRDRSFFSFYNTKFSEEFLMQRVLDQIFHQKYICKKVVKETTTAEPDYYARHNKKVFVFENKDVLIAANIKSSGNIDKINAILEKKFLIDGKKSPGIGQLVNAISQIVSKTFQYDDYVNTKSNITVYPVLLVSDRIFEIPGVNYRLNSWYLDAVKAELGDQYNSHFIKSLTVIDIDTLIFWMPHLESKDSNFRKIVDKHLRLMASRPKVNEANYQLGLERANAGISSQLSPISNRFNEYKFPTHLVLEPLKAIINDKVK